MSATEPELVGITWVARVRTLEGPEEHVFATREECIKFALTVDPFGEPIFQRVDHRGRG